jgi:CDP-glycerol glycerophosphotransferase (TagB/SpsB family)
MPIHRRLAGPLSATADALLAAAYRIVERLVPTSSSACFISFPDADDNALALFAEFLRDPLYGRGNLAWLAGDPAVTEQRLRTRFGDHGLARARVVKKNSLRGLWCFLRAQRIYFTHGHYSFVRSSRSGEKLINVWHGMPLKAIGYLDGKSRDQLQATDKTIASSEFFRPIMAKAFGLRLEDVGVTGLPRCDALVKTLPVASRFRIECLGAAQNLIVWLPTYGISAAGEIRSDSRWDRETYRQNFIDRMLHLSTAAAAHQCHVVVKLHPMDFLNHVCLPAREGVTVLTADAPEWQSMGLYDLLAVSDGLITDLSSVCFDYMATGKPIVIDSSLTAHYCRSLVFDFEHLTSAVWTIAAWEDAAGFFEAVKAAGGKRTEAMAAFCAFSDDRSSERVKAFAPLLVRDDAVSLTLPKVATRASRAE